MNFRALYSFLRDLEKNNSKEWMDEHRDHYHEVRDNYISWLDGLNNRLSAIDGYQPTSGKKAINRINNNLLYHPKKPVYKNHFGAGLDDAEGKKSGDFYIHLGTDESFIAGGFYKASGDVLKSIREAIDYNGEELIKIINEKSFKQTFGEMIEDPDKLKTSPKGYSKNHKYIELLRRKSFAVSYSITQKEVISSGFEDRCVEIYKVMQPFLNYLNKAVTV